MTQNAITLVYLEKTTELLGNGEGHASGALGL